MKYPVKPKLKITYGLGLLFLSSTAVTSMWNAIVCWSQEIFPIFIFSLMMFIILIALIVHLFIDKVHGSKWSTTWFFKTPIWWSMKQGRWVYFDGTPVKESDDLHNLKNFWGPAPSDSN